MGAAEADFLVVACRLILVSGVDGVLTDKEVCNARLVDGDDGGKSESTIAGAGECSDLNRLCGGLSERAFRGIC
jgi:hypothetical protein